MRVPNAFAVSLTLWLTGHYSSAAPDDTEPDVPQRTKP